MSDAPYTGVDLASMVTDSTISMNITGYISYVCNETLSMSLDLSHVKYVLITCNQKVYKFNLGFLKQMILILDEIKGVEIDKGV